MGLLCVCAIFRINHVAKTISLLASRMPVRLEVFLQFSFSNILFLFLLHYTCSVLRSTLEKCLSSCQNVWFCYCTEINIVIYVLYTRQRICGRRGVPGVGVLSLFACPGVGNRPPSENKFANPRGYARGGW